MKTFVLLITLQFLQSSLVDCNNVGDSCEIDRINGRCMLIKDCPEVLKSYQRHGVQPTFCDRRARSICCPIPEVFESRIQIERISAESECFFWKETDMHTLFAYLFILYMIIEDHL